MPRGCSTAPRLPVGHTFGPATVREWQSWHRDGYADGWSEAQTGAALELLALIDGLGRLPAEGDTSLRLRLTRFVTEQRSGLGLLAESPRAKRERAERQQRERHEANAGWSINPDRQSAADAATARADAQRAADEDRERRHRAALGEAIEEETHA